MKRDLTNTMICWAPDTDRIALVKWPDDIAESDKYEMSTGACESHIKESTFTFRKTVVFIEAMHIIIRDGVPAPAVHAALMGLNEYRDGCAEDMPLVARQPATAGVGEPGYIYTRAHHLLECVELMRAVLQTHLIVQPNSDLDALMDDSANLIAMCQTDPHYSAPGDA